MKSKKKNSAPEIENFLQSCSERVEKKLEENFRERQNHGGLIEAVRYSSLGGGKKIRPALVYATAQTVGLTREKVDDVACAIELMHAYSLIHDDLPAMDDDDVRRGRPTLHKAFGEALAILAGDAMQTMAFETLVSSATLDDRCKIKAAEILADVAGTEGMAGGQALDVTLTGAAPDIGAVETMHRLKTGRLMSACIRMTLLCSEEPLSETRRALENYADHVGLCFQIRDDILDLQTDADCENKATYPALLGIEESNKELRRVADLCTAGLAPLDERAQTLRLLTRYIVEREV